MARLDDVGFVLGKARDACAAATDALATPDVYMPHVIAAMQALLSAMRQCLALHEHHLTPVPAIPEPPPQPEEPPDGEHRPRPLRR